MDALGRREARVRHAAARNAALPGGAGGLAWLAAFLDAGGADLVCASGRERGFSDAYLARLAGIQARLNLGARLAHSGVIDIGEVAAARA